MLDSIGNNRNHSREHLNSSGKNGSSKQNKATAEDSYEMQDFIEAKGNKDPKKQEKKWTTKINGHSFNEDELMQFFNQLDGATRFNVAEFFRFFFYHQVYNLGLVPIALPMIFVLEGFKINPLWNLGFLPRCNFSFISQTMLSGIVAYFNYVVFMDFMYPPPNVTKEVVSITNFIHFLLTVTIRGIVVAVKYGYYS